jgi:hypothetical protein
VLGDELTDESGAVTDTASTYPNHSGHSVHQIHILEADLKIDAGHDSDQCSRLPILSMSQGRCLRHHPIG